MPQKNTRPLPGYPGGLLELKLRQIAESRLIDGVVLSTDDPVCVAVAKSLEPYPKPLEVIDRPHHLAVAGTLDEFVEYVPTIMPPGDVVWMHVTSPFFDAVEMDRAIATYRQAAATPGETSLMGVTRLQTFLWDERGCISHDRSKDKWPQTQDLRPFFEVNSSIFILDRDVMARRGDRITDAPILHVVDRHHAFDVDWPDDFDFVERSLRLSSMEQD